jgi:hypothetical protein
MGTLTPEDRETVARVFADLRKYRAVELKENQGVFWSRYGLTQAAGSRYESSADARRLPTPIAMLVAFYALGYISNDDCHAVLSALALLGVTRQRKARAPAGPTVQPVLRPTARQRHKPRG